KGTYLKIDKTGSIDINDGATENIKIDKTNKTIGIKADKDVSVSTNGSFKVTAKENIQMKSTKDLLLEAEGKADIIIKKDMSFEISKNLKGKAGQIELESDSITKIKTKQLMVQGDMVQIQASQVQLQASMIMLGNGGTPAVTMMTKFLGIGFAGTPVVSSAIGPMSSSVFIA
ncbi:MAG TPA: hypothetical protein VI911_11195, partial [Patescibacteria group bacterium]|nr:hypothetical protein [Patescibacteria group bacterium]